MNFGNKKRRSPGQRICLYLTVCVLVCCLGNARAADAVEVDIQPAAEQTRITYLPQPQLPNPETLLQGEQEVYRLSPVQLAIGFLIGGVLALYTVFFVLLFAGVTGLVLSGFFLLVKEDIEQAMPALVTYGPAGGSSLVAAFAWTLLARRFSRWRNEEGEIELEDMFDDVAEQSQSQAHWLSVLVWGSLEQRHQQKVTELARQYSVGLIQYAIDVHSNDAVDKAWLSADEREELMSDLLAVEPDDDNYVDFVARRRALNEAAKLVSLDEIERLIAQSDRRALESPIDVPEPPDRRTGQSWRRSA